MNYAVENQTFPVRRRTQEPDFPPRLALSNFEHLVSLSSEHRNTQTDSQLKTLSG